MNSLARDVVVTLSTVDNTARGTLPELHIDHYWLFTYIFLYAAGMDYTHVSRSLILNASITTQVVEVPIINDHIVEQSEIINLTLVSTDSAVILNPSTSTITIEDVESKLLYVDPSRPARQRGGGGGGGGGSRGVARTPLMASKRFYIMPSYAF